MNIAFVTPRYANNFWNGVGRCTYALAQGLKELGHSITVYAYNSTPVTRKKNDNGVEEISIGGIASDPKKFGIVYDDVPKWNAAISKELRKEEYNVLICVDWFGFEACERFVEQSVNPVLILGIVSALGNNGKGQFQEPLKISGFLEKEKYFLDNCKQLIAFTEGSAQETRKMSHTPVSVVHLSTELRDVEKKTDQGQVLIQGRICRDRYLERGVRAAAELNWISLEVCGPGLETPYGKYVKNLTTKLDVADRVNFKEWIEDDKVGSVYGSAEIVLCPSVYDPFGYSALDAMSYGIPVIGSYESYRGIIRDGLNGLLFQSLSELKTCLEAMHHSRETRMRCIENARKELSTTRTIAKSVERFHEILINSINDRVQDYIRA